MAGRGSRFAKAGFRDPKPLIPIDGRPMIEWVVENLTPRQEHRFIFIAQAEHDIEFGISRKLREISPESEVVIIDGITEGAAVTVLAAASLIDNDLPLMIANSDQFIDISIDTYLDQQTPDVDGLIMTMTATDPKWSFVGFDNDGKVNRVVEKMPISNEATVGIYNFSRGNDFVRSAKNMIARGEKSNGEYYVAPVYNELISAKANIATFNIGSESNGMYGLGIPSDLELFLHSKPYEERRGK